jgi:5-methylcytosine-specific restriction protein A
MKFDKKTVATIEARAKQSCEVCGGVVGSFQIHHRRPRGMGGSKIEVVGSASNGVLVHPACHTRIESNWVILNEDGSKTWTIKPD